MFDQLKNLSGMMKMASQLKERMAQLQEELEHRTVEGTSGGGAARVTMTGKMRVISVDLDPALIASITGGQNRDVENMIAVAFNDAMEKAQQLMAEEMKKITGGMDMPPGMGGLLGQ